MKWLPFALAGLLSLPLLAAREDKWEKIFDGKTLAGWTPKIKGYDFGTNFGKTFRVVNGAMQVSYDGYDEFNERFGHIFYRSPYSKYVVKFEYRFIGEQVKGGPGWAWRNSGIMIHGQNPWSMRKDQDFPVSAEVQLLGGADTGDRTTGNLCTPGTNVVMDGKLITQHCTESKSKTFRGDQWVRAEVEVHGAGLVIHRINGEEVMRYEQVQLDPRDVDGKRLVKENKLLIEGGWISLQSESHPVEFREIFIKKLD